MQAQYPANFFSANRKKLREKIGSDMPIIVTGHGLMQRGGDLAFTFQQDTSFWYLTGIEEPEVILVMDGDDEYLLVPPREVVREQFDGAIDHAALSAISGISRVLDRETGWGRLAKRLKNVKQFASPEPLPAYIDFYTMYSNPARAGLVQKIQAVAPQAKLVDIRKDIARLRMVKQPPEIAALQKAIDITNASIDAAAGNGKLSQYSYEYELEAEVAYGFRKRGSRGHAFDPIVASGASAATIHSMANDKPLRADTMVVIDVGAEYGHYAADICRTYSVGGKPSPRQRAVFAAVADAQQYALGLLKPGVYMKEYEKQVEAYMGKKLIELKIVTETSRESIRRYYPHACSHFLGLDPHDAGDYELPLAPGVVLTCEPGIYVPEESIGVRIEDDILITDTGNTVLSDNLPRGLSAYA